MKSKILMKIMSLTLVLTVVFGCTLPTYAIEIQTASNDNLVSESEPAKLSYVLSDSKNSEGLYTIAKQRNGGIEVNLISNSEVLYKSSEGSVYLHTTNDIFVPMAEVIIEPEQMDAVENIILDYGVLDETAGLLRNLAEKYTSGEVTGDGIIFYTPNVSSLRSTTSTQYVGYQNQTYRDDLVYTGNTSSATKMIKQSTNWGQYTNQTVVNALTALIGSVIDKYSFGSYTILSIFSTTATGPVKPDTSFRHEARLVENKWYRNTFMKYLGSFQRGCLSEKTQFHFYNEVVIAGLNPIVGKDSPTYTYSTSVFNSGADKKAYEVFAYNYSPHYEQIKTITFLGIEFASV